MMRPTPPADAPDVSNFARWLGQRIRERGTSVTAVAEQAAVDKSYLYKVLKSHSPQYRQYKRPGFDKTAQIGRALGDAAGALRAAGYTGVSDGSASLHKVSVSAGQVGGTREGSRPTEWMPVTTDGLPEKTEDWPPELLEAMHYSRTLSPEVQRYIYHLWREQARMEATLAQKRQEVDNELQRLGLLRQDLEPPASAED